MLFEYILNTINRHNILVLDKLHHGTIETGGKEISRDGKQMALRIIKHGIEAANPYSSVMSSLQRMRDLSNVKGRRVILGFGKASYSMALACEKFFGDGIWSGAIIAPKGSVTCSKLQKIKVLEGTHPVPSKLNLSSAQSLLSLVKNLTKDDFVICLISGGGSALLTFPALGISLTDKQEMTRLLLAAGATIGEINCIRKHVSAVKGGQLARLIRPARLTSLILSDVVGDELSSIASGPTCPDPSSFRDAWQLLQKYQLISRMPKGIVARMTKGVQGKVPDTPKPGDKIFNRAKNNIVANNMKTLLSMADYSRSLGLRSVIVTSFLQGEAKEVGKVIGSIARQVAEYDSPVRRPCALFFGGETTVRVEGSGKGGRNQELAISVAMSIKGLQKVVFTSVGSDGIDGNSDSAGAIVDGKTIMKALEKKLDPTVFLDNNDSNAFLESLRCLIRTGPTGTNVNDLSLLLISS